MKKMKKLFSILFVAVFVLAMIIPTGVKAATNNNTLTINGDPNHTYNVYQLATADLSTEGEKTILANIQLGSSAAAGTTVPMIEALKNKKSDEIGEAAKALIDETKVYQTVTFGAAGKDGKVAPQTINNVPSGYYVIVDTATDGSIISRNMVEIVESTTVNPKKTDVTVDKKIDEGNTAGEIDAADTTVNTANIGDKVPYVVESKVPDMTGYKNFVFVMEDELSKGLTYNEDMVVKIGDKTLTEGTDYTVKFEPAKNKKGEDITSIKVAIKDFIKYKDQKDAKIDFVYSATVNNNAKLGNDSNDNDARIIFSNNPNKDYDGTPEFPNPGDVTGIGGTEWKETETYTTGVKLYKVDAATKEKLTGVVFKMTGSGTKTACYKEYQEVYVKDANGTFYLLKDGTYTETAPTAEKEDKYDSTTDKYSQQVKVTNSTTTEAVDNITVTATTDDDGYITITGLDAGRYTFTELKTLDGYNLLKDDITVVISFNPDPKKDESGNVPTKFTATVSSANGTVQTDEHGYINFTVENGKGLTLPETGGIGTTIFYLIGGILVVGAAVVLISKKRMA